MKVKRLVLIIRSTVPPGTCQNLISSILQTENSDSCECSVVAMPEFLRATHAIEDALNPRLTVIGSFDHSANVYVRKLASAVTSKISVFDDPAYAEMIKLAHNAFNATKISFWNEMFQIGQLYGLNTQKVADAVSLTSEASWNPSYGIRGGTPYAGACLPKDVIGFIKHVENAGLNPDMLISIDAVNQKQKQ